LNLKPKRFLLFLYFSDIVRNIFNFRMMFSMATRTDNIRLFSFLSPFVRGDFFPPFFSQFAVYVCFMNLLVARIGQTFHALGETDTAIF